MILNNYYRPYIVVYALTAIFTSIYGSENKKSNCISLHAINRRNNLNSSEQAIILVDYGCILLPYTGPCSIQVDLSTSTSTKVLTDNIMTIWDPSDIPDNPTNKIICSVVEEFDSHLSKNPPLNVKLNPRIISWWDLKQYTNPSSCLIDEGISLAVSQTEHLLQEPNAQLDKCAIKQYCKKITRPEDRAIFIAYLAFTKLCFLQIYSTSSFSHSNLYMPKSMCHFPYKEIVYALTLHWLDILSWKTNTKEEQPNIINFKEKLKIDMNQYALTDYELAIMAIEMHQQITKNIIPFNALPSYKLLQLYSS